MHDITDLPAWERLFKKIVWKQLGDMEGKKMVKVQRLFAKTNLKIPVCVYGKSKLYLAIFPEWGQKAPLHIINKGFKGKIPC